MIKIVSDDSWINRLGAVEKVSYEARAERTITKIVDEILLKVDSKVNEEFGEFMISSSAQTVLEETYSHKKVPLAELLKEKITGNPGFDFHSESETELIAFGEAKYSGIRNTASIAMNQISRFILLKKDLAELVDLKNFTTEKAINNALAGEKAYVAAFSINARKPKLIFENAIKSDAIKPLLKYPELYLIGIELDA